MRGIPLINGEAYSWGQVVCNILGVPVAGITSIEYGDNQEMTDNYGAGNFPVSRGFGKYAAEAKVTLHMEEVEAIMNANAIGRLQEIPEFDIIVSFIPENGIERTHKIKNCRFKNNKRPMKTGDTSVEVELDLITSHIQWR